VKSGARRNAVPATQHRYEGDQKQSHRNSFIELYGVARDAVAEIMPPREIGRRAVSAILDPGEEAAEPSDRDRGGERRGKAQSGRAGDAEPALQDLDCQDRAGEAAEDALADFA